MSLDMTMSHSFSLVYSIPLYNYVTIYLFIRLWIGICIISSLGSWTYAAMNILRVLVYIRIHFCSGTYLGVESLVHGVCVESVLMDSAERFSKAFIPLSPPTSRVQTFQLYIPTSTWCFLLATLVSVFDSNLHVSDDQSLYLFRCDWVDFVEASAYFF